MTLRARSGVTSVRGRGVPSARRASGQPSSSAWWCSLSKRPAGLEAAPRPLWAWGLSKGSGMESIGICGHSRRVAVGLHSKARAALSQKMRTLSSASTRRRHETMSDVHEVPAAFAAQADIQVADYERLYAESIKDPEAFWAGVGKR